MAACGKGTTMTGELTSDLFDTPGNRFEHGASADVLTTALAALRQLCRLTGQHDGAHAERCQALLAEAKASLCSANRSR